MRSFPSVDKSKIAILGHELGAVAALQKGLSAKATALQSRTKRNSTTPPESQAAPTPLGSSSRADHGGSVATHGVARAAAGVVGADMQGSVATAPACTPETPETPTFSTSGSRRFRPRTATPPPPTPTKRQEMGEIVRSREGGVVLEESLGTSDVSSGGEAAAGQVAESKGSAVCVRAVVMLDPSFLPGLDNPPIADPLLCLGASTAEVDGEGWGSLCKSIVEASRDVTDAM